MHKLNPYDKYIYGLIPNVVRDKKKPPKEIML